MRARPAMDRLDVASNAAGLAGALTLLALAVTMAPETNLISPADPGAQTTEIALDLPVETEASEPPPPEPLQETPIDAPQPQTLEETPPPSDAPAPVAARPKPQKPEKPQPKAEERPRKERSDDFKAELRREAREKPAVARRGEAAAAERSARASGDVAAFRACLAGAPYPTSKDARLQKPSGSVGIAISSGSASVTKSSGSAILDSAARSRRRRLRLRSGRRVAQRRCRLPPEIVRNRGPPMKFRVLTLALLAGASTPTLVLAQSAQEPQKPAHDSRSQSGLTAAPTDFGRVDIYGAGAAPLPPDGVNRQDLGGGYMIEEEAVKTRSTVTRDAIAKMSPTANPYQMINLLPGVVITSTDNSGLNGGNIRIRGYNSDQLGLTIEGMPVNDFGNYALYPQEYVDSENIEQISIAQGSPDLDSPHIGASGGVINIYMRDPSKTPGGFVDFSYGMHSLTREFARAETGQIGDFRGYVSYSHYTENHWAGPGSNQRQHVDFKGVWEPGQGNRVGLSVIFNDALNNFYQNPTLGNYNILGANAVGYNTALPASYFNPPAGSPPAAWDRSANQASLYYKWRINPFRNLIVSAPTTISIDSGVTYDAIPYFWYGYGSGGGVSSVTENSFYYGRYNVGGADWNNNGVVTKNDKGMYYNPSITETLRPGLVNKFTFDLGDHKLMLGYWFEYANHRQTAPYAFLNGDGSVVDPFFNSGAINIPGVGAPQFRDLLTQTVTNTGFVGDT